VRFCQANNMGWLVTCLALLLAPGGERASGADKSRARQALPCVHAAQDSGRGCVLGGVTARGGLCGLWWVAQHSLACNVSCRAATSPSSTPAHHYNWQSSLASLPLPLDCRSVGGHTVSELCVEALHLMPRRPHFRGSFFRRNPAADTEWPATAALS
jgi:hypothetical protein